MNIFINGKVSEVKKNINIQDILRMNNISDENNIMYQLNQSMKKIELKKPRKKKIQKEEIFEDCQIQSDEGF